MLCSFQVYSTVILLRIHRHTYLLSQLLFHYRLLQNSQYNSLFYTVGPCCLFYIYQYIFVYVNPKLLIYPSPFSLWWPCLFSMSVHLFLFCKKVHLYPFFFFFKIPQISNSVWYLSFSVWLTSLSMIIISRGAFWGVEEDVVEVSIFFIPDINS